MTRLSLVLAMFAIHALAATAAHADSELSMQDLHALERQKQWTELLDAADRVKPAARTADWARLITAAATRVVEQIERAGASGLRQAGSLVAVVPAARWASATCAGAEALRSARTTARPSTPWLHVSLLSSTASAQK